VEIDLPFFMVANAFPYAIVGALVLLHRRGLFRRYSSRVLFTCLLYAAAMLITPVGGVMRAREGWVFYAVFFVLLGSITWLSLLIWWLAWLAWMGRLRSLRQRPSYPMLWATAAFMAGAMPWIWPLGQLPGGNLWLIPWATLVGAGWLLTATIGVSQRAPRFLLPRDLALEPQPAGDPFWLESLLVLTWIAIGGAPALAIQVYANWSPGLTRLLVIPFLIASAFVVYGARAAVGRRWRLREREH
jgi:hypothetical protein